MSESPLQFEAPGPGPWHQDPVHFPRPLTRYWTDMHPEPFRRGTSEMMSLYGAPLGGMVMAYVNGIAYSQMQPAPDAEIPERFARAEQVWTTKPWRAQLQDWDERVKPASVAKHRSLQAIDPEQLSDEELATYLGECRAHHADMIYQHMRFTAAAVAPTGERG